jgi:probable phosphoglycerate mutase
LSPWVEAVDRDLFVASHGGVARALMHLIAGVAPVAAAEVSIHQGRALLFANQTFRWLG